jgi:hypothetical protein
LLARTERAALIVEADPGRAHEGGGEADEPGVAAFVGQINGKENCVFTPLLGVLLPKEKKNMIYMSGQQVHHHFR